MRRFLELARSPFARDSAILQSSGIVVAAMQLGSTVALANIIGEEEQGLYFLVMALYGLLFMLLNTGVMQATVVQLAAGSAVADTEKVASWQAFLVKLYLLFGLVIVAVGWWLLPWIADRLLDDVEVGRLALWLTAMPFLELPRVVAQATFQSVRRMDALARLELGTEASRVVAAIGLATWLGDARGPVLGSIVAAAVGSLIAFLMYRRAIREGAHKYPGPGAILAQVRGVPVASGLWLGVRIGAMRSIDALAVTILPPLLIRAAGAIAGRPEVDVRSAVTYFRIAQRVVQVPLMLLQGISRTVMPALSNMAGRKDAAGFRRSFGRVTLASGAISVGGMLLVAFARPLLPWVLDFAQLPETYLEPISSNVTILAIGVSVLGFSSAVEAFYVLSGRLKVAILIAGGAFCVTQPLTFFLAWKYAVTGAAVGVSVSYGASLLHPLYASWFFRSGRGDTLFETPSEEAA